MTPPATLGPLASFPASTTGWPELALVLAILAYILYCGVTYRRSMEQLRTGALRRSRAYLETIAVQWLAVLYLGAVWLFRGRTAGEIGLVADLSHWLSSPWALAAWGTSLLISAYLAWQLRVLGRSAEARQQLKEQLGDLDVILPSNRSELRGFSAVSLTAGICEEILFRGFLLWWCQEALGLGLMTSIVVSTAIFGLGHAYQGVVGIFRTAGMGALLMGIYLAAGSLWPAILLHIAADIFGGLMAYRIRPGVDDVGPSVGKPAIEPAEPSPARA